MLDYYSFIRSLEVRWCQSFVFVLLKYFVGYFDSFASPYKRYNKFVDTHKMIC